MSASEYDPDTEPQLRQQTTLWLRAISADIRRAIQQEVDELRRAFEQQTAKLDDVLSASDGQLGQVVSHIEGLAEARTQEALVQARQQAEAAAQTALTTMRAELEAELDTTRAEFETARTTLQTQLAETEREYSAIRQERDEHAAGLDQARDRMKALEEANGRATRLCELAEARLQEEVQRRGAVEKQLCRALEKTSSASHSTHEVLTAVRNGLDDLGSATHGELLSKLVDTLSGPWFAVAVFAVTAQGLQLWKARSRDARSRPPAQVASLEDNSPLGQAFTQRAPVRVDVSPAATHVGLWETPFGHAIALPILAHGRVLAMVYAEHSLQACDGDTQVLDTIAEMFVSCVNRRLDASRSAVRLASSAAQSQLSSPHEQNLEFALPTAVCSQDYPISRQVGRVKIDGTVELLVDGVTSTLVDVSTLGVQVLSPSTLRPNGTVRIVLRNGNGAFTCGGRIVWARLESPRAMSARFRAGIRFTDSHPVAIDAFVARHRGSRTPASA